MRKVYFFFLPLILLFLVPISSAFTQTVSQAWFTSWGSANYDQFKSVATDGSGNVYMLGTEDAGVWTSKMTLIKYNSAGTMQWFARYNGYLSGCKAMAMTIDGSGNIFVAGEATNGSQAALVVVKYNSSAQQQWVSIFDSSAILLEQAGAIKIDGSGNVYIAGTINSELYNYDLLVLKLNSSGVRQWVRTYNGGANGSDFFAGLAVDAAGNVHVVGQVLNVFTSRGGTTNNYDYVTLKYSTTGVLQWTARYGYTKAGFDAPKGIALDGSGNVYVTGHSAGSGSGFDYATVKYNSLGALQWSTRFNSPYNLDDYATAITVDGSGNAYIVGNSRYGSSAQQMATVKYNTSGVQQWVNYYWVGASTQANAIARDASGNVYITGTDNYDVLTLKYTPAGSQAWAVRYNDYWNGTENGQALAVYQSSIVVSTQPSIYVGGAISTNSSYTSYDMNLIKYTQQLVNGSRSELELQPETLKNFSFSIAPNPARGPVRIQYNLPYDSEITLKIYDVLGKEIKTLDHGSRKAGLYQTIFNTGQLSGQMYYYTLVAKSPKGDYKETKPMILTK